MPRSGGELASAVLLFRTTQKLLSSFRATGIGRLLRRAF